MGADYLIDTNIVINFSENNLSDKARTLVTSIIDKGHYFSIINKIELLSFAGVRKEIAELIETATIIGLTDKIAEKTIAIRISRSIRLPDAIIAATALVHDLSIITNDIDGFKNIKGLKVINP